jgi:hypothetical protein
VHEPVDAGVELDQRPLARGGAFELDDQRGRLLPIGLVGERRRAGGGVRLEL